MNYKKLIFLMLVGVFSSFNAYSNEKDKNNGLKYFDDSNKALYGKFGFKVNSIFEFSRYPVIRNCMATKASNTLAIGEQVVRDTGDALADYEAFFPRASQSKVSCVEKYILAAYLDKPTDSGLVKFLALYHLNKVFSGQKIHNGMEMKQAIYAEYFLNRMIDLGNKEVWVKKSVKYLDEKLDNLNNRFSGVRLEETHPAHLYFYDAFTSQEKNRYVAVNRLIDDYVNNPNNVATAFLSMAGNAWIAGESNYDDPTLLYNFLLGSYFSFRAMDLAKKAEAAWVKDPVNNQRFRLASIIGGLSVIQRRSLAKIHHDSNAIRRIDDEHREWRLVDKAFHAFTVGLTFFGESENFLEGYAAFEDGFKEGEERPYLPAVQDRPRFSFNVEGMLVARADFAMKVGDIGSAYLYLTIAQQYMPNAPFWDLGRAAIDHRFANALEITTRYANDDPADDPLQFMVKRHKWGGPDSVCQVCHQQQSMIWSDEEKANIILPPDDILTVGTFPKKSTTWYGAIKDL